MRLALSSRSFARAIERGELTQLEWLDVCSAEPAVDGVDLSIEHFPRRDAEYLAQIKKLSVDRGLSVAGVNTALALGNGDVDLEVAALSATLDAAYALGAPLVRLASGIMTGSPGIAWRELIRALKTACEHAKQVNVTLALAPRVGTLVPDDAAVKRALKECDSAWLRLALPAEVAWETHAGDAVIMVAGPQGSNLAAALRFRGFVSLEDVHGTLDAAQLRRWAETMYAASE